MKAQLFLYVLYSSPSDMLYNLKPASHLPSFLHTQKTCLELIASSFLQLFARTVSDFKTFCSIYYFCLPLRADYWYLDQLYSRGKCDQSHKSYCKVAFNSAFQDCHGNLPNRVQNLLVTMIVKNLRILCLSKNIHQGSCTRCKADLSMIQTQNDTFLNDFNGVGQEMIFIL